MLVTSALLTGCQAALFGVVNATIGHSDVLAQRDVVFDAEHALALDVYRPRDAVHAPVVVFSYGVNWKSGKRHWYRWVGEALAQRGLVVVIPDYRKWPQVRLDGFMRDVARAVAWVHAHAGEYGGDSDKAASCRKHHPEMRPCPTRAGDTLTPVRYIASHMQRSQERT